MTIGNDLEHRLDTWMQEDAALPDDLAEVMASLPETPQRRHRWSITTTELRWRTQSMFSATRVAAFVAIFALGASTALVVTPEGDRDQLIAPAAEAPTLDDMARVTWRSWLSKNDPSSGTVTYTELAEVIEGGTAEYEIDASDDRLSGTATYVVSMYYFDPSGERYPASLVTGSVVLEAEDGGWEGSFVGLDYPGTPDNEGQHILTGTGAYEGLTAVMTTRNDVASGLIFPGDMPALP